MKVMANYKSDFADNGLKALLDAKITEAIDIRGHFWEQCAAKALSLNTGFAFYFDPLVMAWKAEFGPNRHVPNSTYYELPRP